MAPSPVRHHKTAEEGLQCESWTRVPDAFRQVFCLAVSLFSTSRSFWRWKMFACETKKNLTPSAAFVISSLKEKQNQLHAVPVCLSQSCSLSFLTMKRQLCFLVTNCVNCTDALGIRRALLAHLSSEGKGEPRMLQAGGGDLGDKCTDRVALAEPAQGSRRSLGEGMPPLTGEVLASGSAAS